jgi:ZIP family zinc transporter
LTSYVPYLLGLAASVSTYAGGVLAMRFLHHRVLIFGLTSGLVIGLALLDLLPEALASGAALHGTSTIMGMLVLGVALYLLLHQLPASGHIGRATLLLHSLMDGLGIGLAFQISPATGWLVAAAVLAHDMADGANMIGLTAATNDSRKAHRWLLANAAAPLAGVLVGQAVPINLDEFSLLLALLAGGFLYIGIAELLPRSRIGSSGLRSSLATVAGLAIMACVVSIAH